LSQTKEVESDKDQISESGEGGRPTSITMSGEDIGTSKVYVRDLSQRVV
jgi:hypothetical protein